MSGLEMITFINYKSNYPVFRQVCICGIFYVILFDINLILSAKVNFHFRYLHAQC